MKNNIGLIIFTCSFVSSCSVSNTTASEKPDISSLIFFKAKPPEKGEVRAYPTALTSGYVLLKNNCFYLAKEKDSNKNLRILFWPWEYHFKVSKTEILILNEKQKVITKVGSYSEFGGSGNSLKNSSPKVLEQLKSCITGSVSGFWSASARY